MVDLKVRTKDFSLLIIRIIAGLPPNTVSIILGKQLLRAATSVGAHYREALRARSKAEYIAKMNVGLQELEEAVYWLELLGESGTGNGTLVAEAEKEAGELTAIFITIIKKAKQGLQVPGR